MNSNIHHQPSPTGPITQNPAIRPNPDANGVNLAPFPDINNQNQIRPINDGRGYFNNDNLYNRQGQSGAQPDLNGRFSSGSQTQVPLAGYGGAVHVPLA